MALVELLKNNMSAGELSPQARALTDIARYRNGARRLTNWRVLTTGGVTRRPGLRYIATALGVGILLPFEPSTTDAYVLEFAQGVIRFFKDMASTGVVISTPYFAADLRGLRTAQVNDVMILAHASYQPFRLSRTAPTTFVLSGVPFYPPPTFEQGTTGSQTMTLSATTGTITITASSAVFAPSDVQRQFTAAVGRAIITAYTSATVVTAIVIDAFQSTTVAGGDWKLTGSPVAQLSVSGTGPVGSNVTVTMGQAQPGSPELINTDFTTWTDYSGQTPLATGTHTGATNSTNLLVDTAHDFVRLSILTTQVVVNTTDGGRGIVSSVAPHAIGISGLLFGGTENDFDAGDAYTILETGSSGASPAILSLNGGTAGHGWRERTFTSVAGTTYQLSFSIQQAPASVMVGSASFGSDLYHEATFLPGDHTFEFTATGTTCAVQFRNNQNATALVSNVSVKVFTLDGFRPADVGRYVRMHGGLLGLREWTNGHSMQAEVIKELSSADPALATTWSLEDASWSNTLGWPKAVTLYEGRLYFGGSARFPQTIWGSAVDSFFDFFAGTNPEDAVEFSVVDSGGNITLNLINWLMPGDNLMAGTLHGMTRLIGSGDDPITGATPPRARSNTHGSDGTVAPIKVDQAMIYPSRQGSKLREVQLDQVVTSKLQGRDLLILSSHLLEVARLLELAHQPEPLSTIWGVRADGDVIASTYDTSEQINAWWHCVTAGDIESMAVIPDPLHNAHQVWCMVNRATGRFVEVFDPYALMQYVGGSWRGLQVDAAIDYNGPPASVIIGLGHLEGQAVDVVGNGFVFPSQVVSGGQITLPQLTTSVQVGLHYDALGETLPPEVPGGGSIQDSAKHWMRVAALVEKTVSMTVQGKDLTIQPPVPFTGSLRVSNLGWNLDGAIQFEQRQPLPATLLGLVGYLDLEQEQDR